MSNGISPSNRIRHYPGEQRGRLTLLAEIEQGPNWTRRGRFECDCGTEMEANLAAWRKGATQSCGCLQREVTAARSTTHGSAPRGAVDPLYTAWCHMRSRSTPGTVAHESPSRNYSDVACDPRWATFEGFLASQPAGRPFDRGLVLARTGDIGDYSPENTRWATKGENTREMLERERMIRLPDGRFAADVAKESGIAQSTWCRRLRNGWDIERAVTEPPRRWHPHQ